jgi:hypothetical protein
VLSQLFRSLFATLLDRRRDSVAAPGPRAKQLRRQLQYLAGRRRLSFAFVDLSRSGLAWYFPEDLGAEFQELAAQGFEYLAGDRGLAEADVVIATTHGSDVSDRIRELRNHAKSGVVIAGWLFDNHLAMADNITNALALDVVFPSHKFVSGYLANPAAALAISMPACCCQWTREEAAGLYVSGREEARSNQLLVNYVNYDFSWRSELLGALKAGCAQADVLLMAPGDRSRYFGKSREERMREWLRYKATLILPVTHDLSTRVFDALLAGLILVVPYRVLDFDDVIPLSEQQRLGIVRLAELDLTSIREGAAKAVEIYDRMGEAGALARHRFALANHMLVHRVGAMLRCLRSAAARPDGIAITEGESGQRTLRLNSA